MKFSLLTILILMLSCSKKENNSMSTKNEQTYTYYEDSLSLEFTAYKFTTKLGVSGKFDQLKLSNTKTSNNPYKVFENAQINVVTSSINTANPDRDKKIIDSFFSVLTSTDTIIGRVKSINDKGSGMFNVQLNNHAIDVPFQSQLEENIITLTTEINLEDFSAQHAIKSLNEVCKDLHKGPDGLVKLWPNISLVFKVQVK